MGPERLGCLNSSQATEGSESIDGPRGRSLCSSWPAKGAIGYLISRLLGRALLLRFCSGFWGYWPDIEERGFAYSDGGEERAGKDLCFQVK